MGDKIQFDPAYQRVDLIDEEDRQVMAAEKGKREFKEFMDKRDNQEEVVSIEQQPLYEQEVDHNIEEVGIMAVREVRYLTEREWEKMIAMQKNQR